jgi:hypothetical protein
MLRFRNTLRRGLICLAVLSMAASNCPASVVVIARSLPAGVVDGGPAAPATPVRAVIYLQPDASRVAALEQFLVDIQTAGGPSFHQWLTPAEFGERFGASAAQVSAATEYAESAGLKVESVSGLRVVVSGTAAALEEAFAPGIHQVKMAGKSYLASTLEPTVPNSLQTAIAGIGGVDTLPSGSPEMLAADGVVLPSAGFGLADDLAAAVEANNARVLSVSGPACDADFTTAARVAAESVLREAEAQGMTVLASSGCTASGEVSFPAALPEATAVALIPVSGELGFLAGETRPSWQTAPGLPADGLRHEPDLTVASITALTQTFEGILAKEPQAADGSAARLGSVNAILYEMAPLQGLYTQPDATKIGLTGNWEAATGLGLVDLGKLADWFPRGSLSDNVSITVSNPGAVHGQSITFSSTVKDTSGQGNGAVPTGTITWTLNTGVTLGPQTLVNGTASVTTNTLDANYSYTITAQYTGDGTYASSSGSTGFSISPEPASVSGVVSSSIPLGGTISVTVTVASKSDVGTPTGTATVAPQGTSDTNTYTAPLTGSNGTATATVTLPAVQGGNVTLLVNCGSTSANFSCYTPTSVTATVTLGKSMTTVAQTTNGSSTTLTATVTGAGKGYPTPTGNITFYNNGVSVGSATLAAGTASTQFTTPTSGTQSYSATYGGDNNYSSSSSSQANSGGSASAVSLTVSPNPPVSGQTATLQATVISNTSGISVTPTGTVTFYQDGVALAPVSAVNASGVAVYTSTTLSSTTAHTYYAVYSGDSTYATSTSTSVATPAATTVASTTMLTVSPNPPVSGSTTTLQATVASGTSGTAKTPTGTVTFYQDGVALSPVATVNAAGAAVFTSAALSGTTAHTYYAVYSGDTTYSGSTSPSVPTSSGNTVASTTTLTVSPNPPVNGNTTTLQATVASGTSGTTKTPTGSVTFYQDGVALSPVATVNAAGVAVFTSTTLSGTTAHTYYAVYSGDTTYSASTSISVATTAGSSVASTTTLTLTPNPPVTGTATTLQATVASGAAGTTTTPTGTVTFYQDGVALTPVAALSGGIAIFTSTTLNGTGHVYTAKYSGDSVYAAGTSNSVTSGSATAGTTTTALTVTPNPPVSGSLTTLKATIGYTANGTAVPTGTVTFYQDGIALSPTAVLVSGTTATYTSSTLSGTTAHTYKAVYSGDSNYATSTSSVISTAGSSGLSPSTTIITANTGTVTTGGSVTFTALVSPGTATTIPTGTIIFTSSTQGILGAATLNASGAASLTVLLTTIGTQSVTATYSGDSNFSASTSATPAIVTVNPTTVSPVFTLTVSPTVTSYGSTVTLTTNVTAAITSGTVPVGTVTWVLTPNAGGTAIIYTGLLYATSGISATASITIQAPPVGNYTVTATCAGTNFSCTGLTAVAGLAVTKAPATLVLVANPSTPVTGQPELLTAYIQLASGSTASCTGVVSFYVNGGLVGTSGVSGNQATYVLTLPSPNSTTLYAVYSGDGNCQQNVSATLTLSVPPSGTVATITTSSSTVLQGANVTLTVVVTGVPTASNPNPGFPTGTVNFYDTFNGLQSLLGSASLVQNGPSSALATFNTTGLRAGTNLIDGQFAGSRYFSPSDAGITLVNVTDFTVAFSPSSSTTTKGQTVTALATVTAINGFSGQVVLGCVPPAGTATTCSFSPAVVANGNGISTLTITTTMPVTGSLRRPDMVAAEGITVALGMLGLLWPESRRRRPVLLALALSLAMLGGTLGCTTAQSGGSTTTGPGGGSTASGTPSGTYLFNITGSGTDGRTTNMHTFQYSLTVQ